jgi:hypothetical protein
MLWVAEHGRKEILFREMRLAPWCGAINLLLWNGLLGTMQIGIFSY